MRYSYETNTWTNMQDKYALLRYVETQLGRARQTTHAKMRHVSDLEQPAYRSTDINAPEEDDTTF